MGNLRSRQYTYYASPAECPSCRRFAPSLNTERRPVRIRSIDAGQRGRQHTHHDSPAGHAPKISTACPATSPHFRREVHRKVVLPMGGTRRDDNQIRNAVNPAVFIEILIAGIHACNAIVRLRRWNNCSIRATQNISWPMLFDLRLCWPGFPRSGRRARPARSSSSSLLRPL